MIKAQQISKYQNGCEKILQIPGIRFAALINNKGRIISGGLSEKITPYEKDEEKRNVLFMEIALDLTMRKEFTNTLGSIHAIVSYRDKVNIITIPHRENFILLSVEPELDSQRIINLVRELL